MSAYPIGWIFILSIVCVGCFMIYHLFRTYVENRTRRHVASLEAQARDNQDRLKSLMIQRGMSAEEIEQILSIQASPEIDSASSLEAEARIIQVLAENHYDGDDVERILAACRVGDRIDPATAKLVVTMAENWAKGPEIVRILESRRRTVPT